MSKKANAAYALSVSLLEPYSAEPAKDRKTTNSKKNSWHIIQITPNKKPTAPGVWYFLKTAVPPKATDTVMNIDQMAVKPLSALVPDKTLKEVITFIIENSCRRQ